jgi:hypothetical protein
MTSAQRLKGKNLDERKKLGKMAIIKKYCRENHIIY